MLFPPGTQEALYTGPALTRWGQWPTFPRNNPTFTTTFTYFDVITLYKLHGSLNILQADLWWVRALPAVFDINKLAQKCLSGQQGPNLRRGPRHQVLRVLVGISRAGQSCVNLPVGSAHQLCRQAENLLPAQTHKPHENLHQWSSVFLGCREAVEARCS